MMPFNGQAGHEDPTNDEIFRWDCGCVSWLDEERTMNVRACSPEHDDELEAYVLATVAASLPSVIVEYAYRGDPRNN